MATRYDRRIEKLQEQSAEALHKVVVDYDPEETERERARHMAATRGKGRFVVIDAFAADL